jgi:cation transport ATPase
MENQGLEKDKEIAAEQARPESADIAALLEENLRCSRELLMMSKDIKKYIHSQNLWAIFRFFILAIPIVLGFLYLPPFIKDFIDHYRSLLPISYR